MLNSLKKYCAVIAFFVAVSVAGSAHAQAVIRKEINSLTAVELQVFRDAVNEMKRRNVGINGNRASVDHRRSWDFWANMHGHFNSASFTGADACVGSRLNADGTAILGVDVLPNWDPSRPSERDTWCQCIHSSTHPATGQPQPNASQFLTWHRMYLFAFERVLRQAAVAAAARPELQRPTTGAYQAAVQALAVPYWDINSNPTLPLALRQQTYFDTYRQQSVANPLYVQQRATALNRVTPAPLRISADLRERFADVLTDNLAPSTAPAQQRYNVFNLGLEGPHGNIHCALAINSRCANGWMGKLASAANDPVFYLHHSNIDRIFECWLRNGGSAPNDSVFLNTPFTFIDNAGQPITRTVGQWLRATPAQLNYRYGTSGNYSMSAPGDTCYLPMPVEVGGRITAPAGAEASSITAADQAYDINVPKEVSTPHRRTKLIIDGLEPDAEGRMFDVYIVAPKGQRKHITTINFFGMDHHGGHHGHAMRQEFDVTDTIKSLGLKPGDKPKIIIRPTTGLETEEGMAAPFEDEADAQGTGKAAKKKNPLRFKGVYLSAPTAKWW